MEVHLNERVVEFDDMLREYTTDVGNVFQAGKVYRCTGAVPNTELFKDARTDPDIAAALDARGFCKVDDYCQLRGFENIYAGGDILEDRMFASSGEHVITGKKYPRTRRRDAVSARRVHRQEHRAESRRRTERRGELVYVQEGKRRVRRRSRGVFGSQTSFRGDSPRHGGRLRIQELRVGHSQRRARARQLRTFARSRGRERRDFGLDQRRVSNEGDVASDTRDVRIGSQTGRSPRATTGRTRA